MAIVMEERGGSQVLDGTMDGGQEEYEHDYAVNPRRECIDTLLY